MARRRPSKLAVTNCECDRSYIGHLRVLKTQLRGTLPETRLMQWNCTAVNTQSDIVCDAGSVVEEYEMNVYK